MGIGVKLKHPDTLPWESRAIRPGEAPSCERLGVYFHAAALATEESPVLPPPKAETLRVVRRLFGSPTVLERDDHFCDALDDLYILAADRNDAINVRSDVTIHGRIDGGSGIDTCSAPPFWVLVNC